MRYHLKEILFTLLKPKIPKELFNLYHFSLRNVIERIFGVAKKRFFYLKIVPFFSKEIQTEIMYVLIRLYNFIQKNHPNDEDIVKELNLDD